MAQFNKTITEIAVADSNEVKIEYKGKQRSISTTPFV